MDVRAVNKEFTSPPNVAYGVIGNGDANHNPPNMGTALNGPKSERHDNHARGISLIFVQGIGSQHPNKTLLLSAMTQASVEFRDIRKELCNPR